MFLMKQSDFVEYKVVVTSCPDFVEFKVVVTSCPAYVVPWRIFEKLQSQ